MSKSKKLPIYKDSGAAHHSKLRRIVKRRIRQKVRDIINLIDKDSYEIPNPKSIICDWDWCDYTFDFRYMTQSRYIRDPDEYEKLLKEAKIKYSRK